MKHALYTLITLCFAIQLTMATPQDSIAKPSDSRLLAIDSLTLAPDSSNVDTMQMSQTIQVDSSLWTPPSITTSQADTDSTTTQANPRKSIISSIRPSGSDDIRQIISFGKIFWSLVLLLITYLILAVTTHMLNSLAEYTAKYRILFKRAIPIIRITGWALAIYTIIAGVFAPPKETVFAFFASVGVAIGFASQDILKNIFGGLVILFDRPFQVGDKIDMGGHYGEVLEIGLRSVRIVTADDSVVTIPNAEIMNNSVSNSNSGETNCQVVAEIYLPLTIDTNRVRRIATEAAQVSKNIYLKKPIAVLFINEVVDRESLFKMRVKAYVSDPRNENIFKSEMTELIIRELVEREVIEGKS